jgi:hypothetical protein
MSPIVAAAGRAARVRCAGSRGLFMVRLHGGESASAQLSTALGERTGGDRKPTGKLLKGWPASLD